MLHWYMTNPEYRAFEPPDEPNAIEYVGEDPLEEEEEESGRKSSRSGSRSGSARNSTRRRSTSRSVRSRSSGRLNAVNAAVQNHVGPPRPASASPNPPAKKDVVYLN